MLDGRTDIALGNFVGSNIFNVLFILGLSALITPLVVHIQLIRQEVPIMLGASLLLMALSLDGSLGLWDGVLLTGLLLACTAFVIVQSRRETQATQAEYAAEVKPAATDSWNASLPYLAAQQHDALSTFSAIRMGFVVPITLVTLPVVMLRKPVIPGSEG